jgi:2-aminobenzoate-CoA ligase
MNDVFEYSGHQDHFAHENLPARELWPDLVFSLPQLQFSSRINCALHFLDAQCANGFAEKLAVIGADGEAWTYAQLSQKVNQIANVLINDMGLVAGNRVLLRAANSPMLAASILAVFKTGCIAVTTMPLLRAKELQWMIKKAKIQAALCSADLLDELLLAQKKDDTLRQIKIIDGVSIADSNGDEPTLEQAMALQSNVFDAVDTSAEDVCLISFTSGTTGVPKASMHFHRDLLVICECFPRSVLQMQSDDIVIGTSPLAFTFGLGGLLLFPLRVGATVVLLNKTSPEIVLNAIEKYKATICFSVPTFYRQLLALISESKNQHSSSLKSCLNKAVSAGEYLSIATRQAWKNETGLDLIDGLGTTELLHIFISASGEQIRAGATGKVIDGYQACVLDDSGQICPPNVIGALAVKGPTGCRYLDDDRQAHYVKNGWNITGDAYYVDEDGYFYYHSRMDDLIISAGYNIASAEIEEILMQHHLIQDCAVIGVPDEERGQIVQACIVLKTPMLAHEDLVREIQLFVRDRIAPFKYPRSIIFMDSLPRTETGKLQRFKLKT